MNELVLRTNAGAWSPLFFLAALAIALAIAYIIRSRGEKKFKAGTEQATPFFSANRPPAENIAASNFYWGFFSAMRKYYALMQKVHTGIVNDYVFCFVVLLVIIFAVAAAEVLL